MWNEMRSIPEEIRGTFAPSSVVIYAGTHDIYEDLENSDGTLFGSTWFSVALTDYGSPLDAGKYRNAVGKHPAVADFQSKLESILGRTEICIFWQ